MRLRPPSYSIWYPALVILVWAYPASWLLFKGFWAFVYIEFLDLPAYMLKHVIGIGFILLAVSSGFALSLNLLIWAVPRLRRALHPHWTTNIAAFAALWLFYGTSVIVLSRQYPYIPLPPENKKPIPGDVSGHV
jgi:hypothetical protein